MIMVNDKTHNDIANNANAERVEVTARQAEMRIRAALWLCPHCGAKQQMIRPDVMAALFDRGDSIDGSCGRCEGAFTVSASRLVRMIKNKGKGSIQ